MLAGRPSTQETVVEHGTIDLLNRLDALYTAVVADCLDRLDYRHQVLCPSVRPLYPEARMVGVAFPVLVHPVYEVPAGEHYQQELAAVDNLKPGHAMVVSRNDGSFWGELLSTAARMRGANGIVLDGYGRDAQAIMRLRFPTFLRGIHCSDSLGRIDVREFDVAVESGGVLVRPGDLIIADYDGVVVLPRGIASDVIALAEEKVRGEDEVRAHLEAGMPVTEAFERFGVL